jgi:AraC-like DNA-binding protein
MRVAGARPGKAAGAEAARGLEQELIYALVQCLSAGPVGADGDSAVQQTRLMARFEQMVIAHPRQSLSVSDICSALGVAPRTLRDRCHKHLGIGPNRYGRLYRLLLARRALRGGDPGTVRVSQVAGEYGFKGPSRFAASYRALFDEAPSATLQRGLGG